MKKEKKTFSSPAALCPCNSTQSFESCCSPLLAGIQTAETPEQLMRSRYSAFVHRDVDYLLSTWSAATRPQSLDFDDNRVWLNLVIVKSPAPSATDETGYVSFIASFIENDTLVEMSEKSIFIRKNGLWFYQQGEASIKKQPISTKKNCPCGSGKKFKRCCRV